MLRGIRTSAGTRVRAWVCAAAVAALCIRGTAAALADGVDDEVAAFRAVLAAGDDAAVASRVKVLAATRDKRVDDALLAVVRSPKLDGAAAEAMRALASRRNAEYLRWVRTKLCDEKLADEQPRRHGAMIDSLAAAGPGIRTVLPDLAKCVLRFAKTRSDVTGRAIASYSSLAGDKEVVEGLIGLVGDLEDLEPGASGRGGRGRQVDPLDVSGSGNGSASGDPGANVRSAKDAALKALERLTGGTGGTASAWRVWWVLHEKDFKVALPEFDWPSLREFPDDVHGYVLRKPAQGTSWVFEKSPFLGGRARLRLPGAAGDDARLDVATFPKESTPDAAAFAESVGETWRTGQFGEFAEGGEPSVRTRTIGGRAFSVVTATGTGGGSWAVWGEMERRAYVTLSGNEFLVFEGAVRRGLDDATQKALWAAVEGMAFRKAK